MKTIHLEDGRSALVIVAHPDDETIWMGGTILKHPQVNWTIFSLCRASDKDRAPKFAKVCQHYGAQAIITDLDDEDKLSLQESIPIIQQLIKENIKNSFDYFFTHGANGEYGHPRHIGTHQAITKLITQNILSFTQGFYFNYQEDKNKENNLIPKPNSDYILELNQAELLAKKKIVAEMYGYPWSGIDVNYCTQTEGFKIIK